MTILEEHFLTDSLHESFSWRSEPSSWKVDTVANQLVLYTDKETDYWQKTHYGFQADNGHFLHITTSKNFRMTTRVKMVPNAKYDQAGLMIRVSADVWVKASLEFIQEGHSKLGAVVTNRGYSDWSTQHVEAPAEPELFYRMSRIGENVYVDVSWDGENWQQIRIAHLEIGEDDASVMAGLYACSPQGENQVVRFDYLVIEELPNDPAVAYL
ncbi:DUF1349 domain-containing protein [Paenalkalicoccus suaedae]|uniref:DUF1349 domain-containing protein n=1 Tax=Paenalkalicoccus suaedae TaxID=2592382 RepID=A0A859FIM1_9BACI|nr:DUF1349 domain-containing protein [Paenalkalicoccus suaedae]QKS72532.1 DUF1349 domain-containing protein [Paenalkalicoccus suaedae]